MTDMEFCRYTEYDDGKMARLATMESSIPVNIYAEPESDFSLSEGDSCCVDIIGIGSDIDFYKDEAEFEASGTNMAPVSMIPMGTFSVDPDDDDFKESPHIIFSGKVTDVQKNPEDTEDEPNYCVTVETLEMTITVYLRYDGDIGVGGILYGIAWLYGILKKS